MDNVKKELSAHAVPAPEYLLVVQGKINKVVGVEQAVDLRTALSFAFRRPILEPPRCGAVLAPNRSPKAVSIMRCSSSWAPAAASSSINAAKSASSSESILARQFAEHLGRGVGAVEHRRSRLGG